MSVSPHHYLFGSHACTLLSGTGGCHDLNQAPANDASIRGKQQSHQLVGNPPVLTGIQDVNRGARLIKQGRCGAAAGGTGAVLLSWHLYSSRVRCRYVMGSCPGDTGAIPELEPEQWQEAEGLGDDGKHGTLMR